MKLWTISHTESYSDTSVIHWNLCPFLLHCIAHSYKLSNFSYWHWKSVLSQAKAISWLLQVFFVEERIKLVPLQNLATIMRWLGVERTLNTWHRYETLSQFSCHVLLRSDILTQNIRACDMKNDPIDPYKGKSSKVFLQWITEHPGLDLELGLGHL